MNFFCCNGLGNDIQDQLPTAFIPKNQNVFEAVVVHEKRAEAADVIIDDDQSDFPGPRREQLPNKIRAKTDNDDIDDDNRKEEGNNIGRGATRTNEDDTQPPEKEPPVVGRDYVIHTVVPSDTFSGLLLRYKVTAAALRRINRFLGTNLALAPPRLVVPLTGSLSNKYVDWTSFQLPSSVTQMSDNLCDDGDDVKEEEPQSPLYSLDVVLNGDVLLAGVLPYLEIPPLAAKKIVCRQWREECDAAINNKGRKKKKRFVHKAELRGAVERYCNGTRDIAEEYGYPIGRWDVSRVRDFSWVFASMETFNEDIGAWNVGKATNMNGMFYCAYSFNQNLSWWDFSNVQDMDFMFRHAYAFNGDISTWDTSSVNYMNDMFTKAIDFNGDISAWDISSVREMIRMFFGAAAFNRDISGWNVHRVSRMEEMFSREDEDKFDPDILSSIQSSWERQGQQWR